MSANQIHVDMSGKGNCHDDAVILSFWLMIKNEWVHYQKYNTY